MRRVFRICLLVAALLVIGCLPEGLLPTGTDDGSGGGTNARTVRETYVDNPDIPQTGSVIPEFGASLAIRVVSKSPVEANVTIRFFVDDTQVHLAELHLSAFEIANVVGPDLATEAVATGAYVTGRPTPTVTYVLIRDFEGGETKDYVIEDPNTYTLSRAVVPSGAGSITQSPDSETYAPGTAVTLTAVPNEGYRLRAWSGTDDDTSAALTNTVTMTSNRQVTAEFEPVPCVEYPLTTQVIGAGGTLLPPSGSYCAGTQVTLTAQPNFGMQLKAWHGTDDDESTALTNTVTMTSARSVAVEFKPVLPQHRLVAGVKGGHGTIEPTGGIFDHGTVVTLVATPDTGYRVKAWTGTDDDESTGGTNTVTMNTDKTVAVAFEARPAGPVLNLQALPGDGDVTLTWDPSENATGYKVYRLDGEGVAEDVGDQTSIVIPELENGARYCFMVTAYNIAGIEGEGATVCTMPRVGVGGLIAYYSNGIAIFEGPVYNGVAAECSASGGNLYEGQCTSADASPIDWTATAGFQVIWKGYIYAPVGGEYRFTSEVPLSGVIRIELKGIVVADFNGTGGNYDHTLTLEEGSWTPVSMSFAPNGGANTMVLGWKRPGRNWEPIPRQYLAIVTARTDIDVDGDVDLTDFYYFNNCFNGPNKPPALSACDRADFDEDGDVDLNDFDTGFQPCFNGPNRPPVCY